MGAPEEKGARMISAAKRLSHNSRANQLAMPRRGQKRIDRGEHSEPRVRSAKAVEPWRGDRKCYRSICSVAPAGALRTSTTLRRVPFGHPGLLSCPPPGGLLRLPALRVETLFVLARRFISLLLPVALFVFGVPAGQVAADAHDGRWAILLAGVSGDPALQMEYLRELRDLRACLEGSLQFRADRVFVLFDDVSKDPELIQYQSTRENLARVCRAIAGRAAKDDLVFAFILGHGSYDGSGYKLNLVGPDPTAQELAAVLYSIPAQHFVVVNTTTCSGSSTQALSGKGRVIITSTRSGSEKNLTHMGGFFVEALRDGNADTDKNGRVSLLEAFNYAAKKVEQYYSSEGNIQTEHSMLDDNGDGNGHPVPGPENGDGLLARTTYLDPGPEALAKGGANPERQKLALEAQSLEQQIEALKFAKGGMPQADYEKKLEELLVKLARVNAQLRKQ